MCEQLVNRRKTCFVGDVTATVASLWLLCMVQPCRANPIDFTTACFISVDMIYKKSVMWR